MARGIYPRIVLMLLLVFGVVAEAAPLSPFLLGTAPQTPIEGADFFIRIDVRPCDIVAFDPMDRQVTRVGNAVSVRFPQRDDITCTETPRIQLIQVDALPAGDYRIDAFGYIPPELGPFPDRLIGTINITVVALGPQQAVRAVPAQDGYSLLALILTLGAFAAWRLVRP